MNSRPSPVSTVPISHPRWLDFAFLTALFGCAIFLWNNGFRVFKSFDMGSFIDMAWRIYKGQKPFVDFVTYVGPVHSYWMAYFFHLFGFGKTAIWACTFTTAAAAMTATYLALRGRVPLYAGLAALAVTTTGFNWAFSHPYYTHTAQAICLLATAFLARRVTSPESRASRSGGMMTAWIFCGFACVVAFLTKPNVGAAYAPVFFVAAMAGSGRLPALVGLACGSLLAAGLASLIWVPDWTAFIQQTILQYGAASGNRLEKLAHPTLWLLSGYWLIALLALTACMVHKTFSGRLVALFLGLYFVGIFEMSTSGAVWQSNVPVMGLYVGFAYLIAAGPGSNFESTGPARKRMLRGILALLTILSCVLIARYVRYDVEVKAWMLPDRHTYRQTPDGRFVAQSVDPMGQYALQTGPLKGWKTEATQGRAIDEISEFIRGHVPAAERLMVMTDLQVLNAVTGRQTLASTPAVWTVNYLPAPGKPLEDFRRDFMADSPEWIVTHSGGVAFISGLITYLDLEAFLKQNYRAVLRSGNYVVLKKIS